MVGRKRKLGKRERNGRLQREKIDSPQTVAASMPHRRWLPADKRHDQKAENPLGALSLIGAITTLQYDAGIEYRRRVGRYRLVLESPNPNPAGLALDGRARGSITPFITDEDAKKRKDDHNMAFEALNESGRRNLLAVNLVAIKEEPIGGLELPYLRKGLDVLVVVFGLSAKKAIKLRT